MRKTSTAVALTALTLAASVAVVACTDDRPACAATLAGPGGGSSSRSSTSSSASSRTSSYTGRSYSTNLDRARTNSRIQSRTSTGRTYSKTGTTGGKPNTVTYVQIKHKPTTTIVNNHTVIVQPRPVVRRDGWRYFPDYGWYFPPHVYPYGYSVTYNCVLPADAVEEGPDVDNGWDE